MAEGPEGKRRRLAEAKMGLGKLERLADLQLELLEGSRQRLASLARAGEPGAWSREARKAEATARELHASLAQVLALRATLDDPQMAAFDAEFAPLKRRLEKVSLQNLWLGSVK